MSLDKTDGFYISTQDTYSVLRKVSAEVQRDIKRFMKNINTR